MQKSNFKKNKVIFNLGEYKIILEKESTYDSNFSNGRHKMIFRYLKNARHGNNKVEQQLLTKIYEANFKEDKKIMEYEQEYTYGLRSFIPCCDSQDKYVYFSNNTINYGINEIIKKDPSKVFNDICFEGKSVFNYLPVCFVMYDYINLVNKNISSAIVFKGKTSDGISHELEITKTDDEISITYTSSKTIKSDKYYIETKIVDDKKINLPILSKGNITIEELNNVILLTQSKLNNEFISLSLEELNNFNNKLSIKKGIINEQLDPLSPKILIDKPLDEIEKIVNSNKDEYFKLAQEQFETMTNSKNSLEGKTLRLK